jgi:hypothetical protein
MVRVGLLRGGSGLDEPTQAGAFHVYRDPYDLLDSLDGRAITLPG